MKPTTSISNIQVYGAHAEYKAPPSEAQADAGVVPLDTLPAAWWNQLWYDITSRNNSMVETVLNIRDEILSVLSNANINPSALQNNQLLQSIEVIRRRFPSFDAISHDPIPGSVISSAARNSVSVDSATGQMTVNALSDWTSPDSVKTVIDNIDTSNPVQYSTSEFDMGKKWIDGEQIYGRVLTDLLVHFRHNSSFPSSYASRSFIIFKGTLYVVTTRGVNNQGIYTSTDGITFTQNASFPLLSSVISLFIFNDTLCVGTNSAGIYTSTDGITFTQNTSFPSSYSAGSFIIFNDTLYVGANGHGIYTSTDGITFTQNTSFPSSYSAGSFIIFNDTLYVGANSDGIYTSTDGITFTQNSSFPSSYSAGSFIIFNDTLYVGTNGHGIYTSTDGITFTQNTSFPMMSPRYSLFIFNDTLYVGTNGHGIYTSTDGITFTQNTSFPSNYTASSFIIFKGALYVGIPNGHGIYISTDGITFTQNTTFPSNSSIFSFIIFNDTLYVGTNSRGIYTSTEIGFATALSNIAELLFTQLRGSAGPLGLKSAHIDNSNHLVVECDGTPTQAIIEYTKTT